MAIDSEFELQPRMRIGIDLGGTKIAGVLLDETGQRLQDLRCPTPRDDYAATLGAIVELVMALEAIAAHPCTVGIGTPGAVRRDGRMKNCNSTWLNDQPLVDDLRQHLQRPIRLANDADCFALAEAIAGAGRGHTCVFGVILGTGVGGGLVLNKQVRVGANRLAGEWGHLPLPTHRAQLKSVVGTANPVTRQCYCGGYDCVETYLSGPGLERSWRERSGAAVGVADVADIVRLSEEGEHSAEQTLREYEADLAMALTLVLQTLDPDVIVLGGGLSNLQRLYQNLPRLLPAAVFGGEAQTPILPNLLGDASGVLGAAHLWSEWWEP